MDYLTKHFSIHLIKGASLKSNVRDWEMKQKSEAIREKAGGKQIRKLSNELSLRISRQAPWATIACLPSERAAEGKRFLSG